VWVQDEPENMGPWPFVHARLHRLVGEGRSVAHRSRAQSASPAAGSSQVHKQEEQLLLDAAFAELD
jgi:2-oxoglutarate dehydrogenase E1 component